MRRCFRHILGISAKNNDDGDDDDEEVDDDYDDECVRTACLPSRKYAWFCWRTKTRNKMFTGWFQRQAKHFGFETLRHGFFRMGKTKFGMLLHGNMKN